MDYLIHHMLRTSAGRTPTKEALVHKEQRLTYHDAWTRVSGFAEGLARAGLQRGDRVGIYLEPSVAQAISIFGVSKAGGVFVPINSLLFPDQVVHIARNCSMRFLVAPASRLSALAAIQAEVPSLEGVVVVPDGGPVHSPWPTHDFETLCRLGAGETERETGIEKDLAAILYTSGSTGKPKGVMLSHAQVMAGSSIVSRYLEITAADRILAILPFTFDAGLNQIMTAFQQGATIVLMTFVFAREIVQTLLRERISGLAGVPTLWSLLAQRNSTLDNQPLPHLRYITNTGGVMPQPVLAAVRAALPGTRVFLMYGLTEAFRSTYLPPEELDRRPTSIGRAIPNTEILVINAHGQLSKPGEVGELVHRGPTVSMGYWGEPELTAQVLRPHPLSAPQLGDTEKVCYSGDYVTMDEEGYLFFVGRRDTMIKCSGFRISPTEVEEVLFQSGLVKGAAVIGVPDPSVGQFIKAFVVGKDGGSINTEELLQFCSARSPRHMVPRVIEMVDDLPKTSSGKVDYPALRRREGL